MNKEYSLSELMKITPLTETPFSPFCMDYLDKRLLHHFSNFPKKMTKEAFLDFLKKHIPFFQNEKLFYSMILPISLSSTIDSYLLDLLKRFFLPIPVKIACKLSLAFSFEASSHKTYFLYEFSLECTDRKFLQKNASMFLNKLKLDLLTLLQSKKIALPLYENAKKEFFPYQKLQSLENKLSRLIDQKKPKNFDTFLSRLQEKSLPFSFTSSRSVEHLSQMLAYENFFKNNVQELMNEKPHKKHVRIKIFDYEKNILGILIVFNLTSTLERFNKEHLIEALIHINPNLAIIHDSFLADKSDDKIQSFYIEIHKDKLSNEEIKNLKKMLSEECKARIENIFHPIFMPRNDEELFRNIILLSQQIHFVTDFPQVILQYEKQEGKNVVFTVVWVRVLTNKSSPLSPLFLQEHSVKLSLNEVKIIGFLKKKHTKEANIFTISFDRSEFIRKDNFLDLQKARLFAAQKLTEILGEFRDYNGGMINKQLEALDSLKKILPPTNEELLEEFFYSLKPTFMQTILPTPVLEILFKMIFSLSKQKLSFVYRTEEVDGYYLIVLMSKKNLKEKCDTVINKLQISSSHLTQSFLTVEECFFHNYIYHLEEKMPKALLLRSLLKETEDVIPKESFHFNQSGHLIKGARN